VVDAKESTEVFGMVGANPLGIRGCIVCIWKAVFVFL